MASRPDDFNPYAAPESATVSTGRAKPAGTVADVPDGPIAVTVNVSDEDVADFLAYHHGRRSRLGPVVRMSLPILLVIGLVDLALWQSGRFTVATLVFNAVWLLTALALFPWLWRRQLRKVAGRGGPRNEHTVEIGPSGLVGLAMGKPAVRRSWAVVSQIVEAREHFFFYVSDPEAEIVSVEIVPRREFATPEDAERFLAAARSWKDAASLAPEDVVGQEADSDAERLVVTFERDDQDRLYASRSRRRVLRRDYARAAVWGLISLIWTVFLGIRLFGKTAPPRGLFQEEWVPGLVLFVIMLSATLWMLGAFLRLLFRRRVPATKGQVTVAISPEGYMIREADGSRTVSQTWTAVPGVGSDRDYLIIAYQVFDPRRGLTLNHPIPRRAFATPEAAEAFLNAARSWHAAAHGLPDPAVS